MAIKARLKKLQKARVKNLRKLKVKMPRTRKNKAKRVRDKRANQVEEKKVEGKNGIKEEIVATSRVRLVLGDDISHQKIELKRYRMSGGFLRKTCLAFHVFHIRASFIGSFCGTGADIDEDDELEKQSLFLRPLDPFVHC
ncbi:unnamed protein product [Lactuca virosa]|uniref:Uncharacterized protein n=1 Tax=Lactuca virosa TaxID=75947 RepID=A0AAU9MRI8_9ASTR|nr:unnamed protein product [Lactuca virosa]